jgi:hypothetical protein
MDKIVRLHIYLVFFPIAAAHDFLFLQINFGQFLDMGYLMCVLLMYTVCTAGLLYAYKLNTNSRVHHRVYRVPDFLSGRPNWLPPPPHPPASVVPPFWFRGGYTR